MDTSCSACWHPHLDYILEENCVSCGCGGPAIDIEHLTRQREWSTKIFGPGPRAFGVVDHIRKELNEIEGNPADLFEWVDVIILALDGAWREGWTPLEIITAIKQKQEINEKRNWPDWRLAENGKAIEHIRLEKERLFQEEAMLES